MTARAVIESLGMLPHPEGGYYRETYRANIAVDVDGRIRPASTAIYYLLEEGDLSSFHRIRSDEIWFHHGGQAMEIVSIHGGQCNTILLGNDPSNQEQLQAVIPAHTWFAARTRGNGFSLVSCVVAPGFDFADFELADREKLLEQYPQLRETIIAFTRTRE